MIYLRRCAALLGIGIIGISILGLFISPAAGQKALQPRPPFQPGGPPSSGSAASHSSIKITEDSRFRQVLNVGRDCIKDKEWKQAVEALQAILKEKDDHYVQVRDPDPNNPAKDIVRWTSAKFEANNLLGSMDIEGLQMYEQEYGAEAKTKLDLAKKDGDRQQLADVAQRYCHTQAGIEANELQATVYLARGQVFTAALRFEKLLAMNQENAKLSDLTLFKAALAFRRAGDSVNYEAAWKRIQENLKNKPGLKVGDDMFPVAKLDEVLKEAAMVAADPVNVHDWSMTWGNNTRTAQAIGSPPLLDAPLWKRPIMSDVLDGLPDKDNDGGAEQRVGNAIKALNDQNLAVLPGSFPLASQGLMVYRTQRGLCAVALKEFEVKDEYGVANYKPGQIVWKSIPMTRSLAVLLEKTATRNRGETWIGEFEKVPGFSSLLFENTTIGSIATDHRFVYAINDLGVPPHPGVFQPFGFNQPLFQAQEFKSLLESNELGAYDLLTGKLRWDLGPEDGDFKDSHFLGTPITVGGKLYVLNEKHKGSGGGGVNPFGQPQNPYPGDSQLRIVCIDPNKLIEKNQNTKPEIVSIQALGEVLQVNRALQDLTRRVNAVHLAYGEGVLVCPTNAGEVFGFDLMTRSLVWSYPYRENAHQMIVLPGMNPNPFPRPGMPGVQQQGTTIISKWKSAPPALQDGKVVFTAPDADSVHCISLRDGKPLWKRSQIDGDLYMAGVFKGKVLIVGKTHIRALSLQDGSQVWSVFTGDLPAGQGVASKDVYYLPLKKGEIIAVDIERGQVKAHNRSANQASKPGNLVFYEGMVLSQTATEVMAYPQLSARLTSAKAELANDPQNMVKLTDYGELLLKDGQVNAAVDALLKVYNSKPAAGLSPRVNERLFEALTDLMQADFDKAAKDHLTVYDALTTVPGNPNEEQQRKSKFYRLLGQGRQAQGNLVEAFQMFKEFGALPIHRQQGGITSLEDPNTKIPVNVWLRGRISGMIEKATPEQKAPLEATIAKDWAEVEKKNDPDSIRSFVGMFDTPVKVGREARVRLAETLMDRNDRASFLEAELYLHQVLGSEFRKEAATGGRALAALAKLEETKATVDSMKLAADYYRQLDRDFGNVPVRGSKTGADLKNELATDKRFLPFLEETSASWGPVKMSARQLGQAGLFSSSFVMQPLGDQTPFARQSRLLLDPSNAANPRVRLREAGSTADRWTSDLGANQMNQQIFYNLYQNFNQNQAYHPNSRFRFYHVKGHLVVCQVGVMIYCLDGDTGKKLWEYQTVDNIQNNGLIHLQQVMNDEEGNPEFLFWNQLTNQRFRVALGRIGTVQASYVAVVGQKGLSVVDPLKGGTMWKRADVPLNTHVFGDDQYLFLAEVNSGGSVGVGRTLRANDGELMKVPDFSAAYQHRIKVFGRQILTAGVDRNNSYTVRLYDIVAGKDVWSKQFPAGSFVLQTEDSNIAGIIDPKGGITVVDAKTGAELLTSNVLQGRIGPDDIKGLQEPLLLQDSERFYVALNKPVDGSRVVNRLVFNNFSNGTRSLPINGWVLALNRADGERKIGDRVLTWKKGSLAWHSDKPMLNQLLVMEQFEQSPILLFTARYMEAVPNLGNPWTSVTQSLSKTSGKWIFDSGPVRNVTSPAFHTFTIDSKLRVVNLLSLSPNLSVQHFVDDGKGPPAGGVMNPGGPGGPAIVDGTSNTIPLPPGIGVPRIAPGPNGQFIPRPKVEVVRPIELPAIPR